MLKTRRIIAMNNGAPVVIKVVMTVAGATSVVFPVLAFVPLFPFVTVPARMTVISPLISRYRRGDQKHRERKNLSQKYQECQEYFLHNYRGKS